MAEQAVKTQGTSFKVDIDYRAGWFARIVNGFLVAMYPPPYEAKADFACVLFQ
jgi:hypothetical protein